MNLAALLHWLRDRSHERGDCPCHVSPEALARALARDRARQDHIEKPLPSERALRRMQTAVVADKFMRGTLRRAK